MVLKLWDPPRAVQKGKLWRGGEEEEGHGDNDGDEDEEQEEKKEVGWYELFFDLVFVTIIAQIALLLEEEFSEEHDAHHEDDDVDLPWGLSSKNATLVSFCYFGWISFKLWSYETLAHARFNGGEDIIGRILGFCFMWQCCSFAGSAHAGITDMATLRRAARSAALTSFTTFLRYMRGVHHNREMARPLMVQNAVSLSDILLWLCAAQWAGTRETLVLVTGTSVITLQIASFVQSIRFQYDIRLHGEYVFERLGLLTIIVLGETVVACVNGITADQNSSQLTLVALGFALIMVYSTWWIYFDNGDYHVFDHYRRSVIYGYLHALLMLFNTSLAAGLTLCLHAMYEERALTNDEDWLVCASFCGVIVCQNCIRLVMRWSLKFARQFGWLFIRRVFYSLFAGAIIISAPFMIEYWDPFELLAFCAGISIFRVVVDVVFGMKVRDLDPEFEEQFLRERRAVHRQCISKLITPLTRPTKKNCEMRSSSTASSTNAPSDSVQATTMEQGRGMAMSDPEFRASDLGP